jgi:hypothetical protein
MLQHLVFEDELEARRRSNELLLDGIARGGVFGGVGLGRASRGARRSRALDGVDGGGGGVCLLAGRHGGLVCLRAVSHVPYTTAANAFLDAPVHRIVLQKAMCISRDLQEDVVGVVGVEEICLVRALYVYYPMRQDRASLSRQILCQGPTTLLVIPRPGYNLLL